MNHQKIQKIKLSQAIAGYLLNLAASQRSENTVRDYKNCLRKFQEYLTPDILVTDIKLSDIESFMANLTETVSKKTSANHHSTINRLYTWLLKNKLVESNLISLIERPKPEKRVIDPIPEQDIKKLIEAARYTLPYSRLGKAPCRHRIITGDRNIAMIMFFMDNGVRVSELCNLKMKDYDAKNLRALVMGKGAKERFVPISARTAHAIWMYHNSREDLTPEDYVFASTLTNQRKLDRVSIGNMFERIGKRAGVPNVHPHRFRHTFAITFLRAGGDIYTLQHILGHETSDMTRHYSKIAAIDVKRVHRRASPVEYLRL